MPISWGMLPPSITSSSPHPGDGPAPPPALSLDDVKRDAPILARRDVALVPWIVISIGAFALALSQLLRPVPGGEHSPHASAVIIAAGVSFGIGSAFMVLIQETPWGEHLRGKLGVYLLGFGVLTAGMVGVALLDRGLSTVAYTGMLLTAPFLSMVLPTVWSRVSLAVLLAATITIQLILPTANLLEAGSLFALVCAGWIVGYLPRWAHAQTNVQALLLSRSDQLTGALNRRGFLDQLEDELHRAAKAKQPLALMVIDLNGFKLINDSEGHAAGDELLSWAGETIPTELPDDAGFGRMGGDEFAVVLPGATALAAHITAQRVLEALAERVGASIGVATAASGEPMALEPLMQAADAALYAGKADPVKRVQVRRAEPADSVSPSPKGAQRKYAAFTYAELRAAGGPPGKFTNVLYEGRTVAGGFWTVAAAGAVVVAVTLYQNGDEFWQVLLQILGIPWVLANFALGLYFLPRRYDTTKPPLVAFYSSVVLIGVGITGASLSSGIGAMMPITAGLYLKAFFDASMVQRKTAYVNLAFLLACWLGLLLFGPRDALWVAPFQLALMLGCFAFGTIGYNAFSEATKVRLRLANTDGLTRLLNRRGFEHVAGDALERAARGAGSFAVISFDLDNFKGVNDTLGHAAGDELLCSVASATTECLPGAQAIGRIGGDEFVAAVPASSLAGAVALADLLNDRLESVTGGSIGCAIYPDDGTTLDELLKMADHRAYAVKKTRARRVPSPPVDADGSQALGSPEAHPALDPEPEPDA